MGLFGDKTALKPLQDRLAAVEARCDGAERQLKLLRLEWEDLYDKVRHQMSRISRRVASSTSEPEPFPAGSTNDTEVPNVDPISRSIMLRRGMQGLKK